MLNYIVYFLNKYIIFLYYVKNKRKPQTPHYRTTLKKKN